MGLVKMWKRYHGILSRRLCVEIWRLSKYVVNAEHLYISSKRQRLSEDTQIHTAK